VSQAATFATPTDVQAELVETIRRFVEREVVPVASKLDHDNEYPHQLVARMRELGLFGATIPTEYGGLGLDVSTYAMIIEELCVGWMTLSGILNTHLLLAYMIRVQGTDDQKKRYLAKMAKGEFRGALCLTESHAGSDVQNIRTTAIRRGDDYVVNGSKMFVTNGREGSLYALVCKTDPKADPPHKGMSLLIAEKGPGVTISRDIEKLGYKGVDTVEIAFEDFHVPAANLLGGVEGHGMQHVLNGLEVGRINIASRAVGVARAAFECASATRSSADLRKPIQINWAIQAEARRHGDKIEAARPWFAVAADKKDGGERPRSRSRMAKLFASETCAEVSLEVMRPRRLRLHEGIPVERFHRDAPLMIIGEGTNEINARSSQRQLKYAI
jgi:alkylation response protein AidB-like acyl-CoA dehydrogenase